MKKRINSPCITPPYRCIFLGIEPALGAATREREQSLKAVIVRGTHGHAHSNRAKQANGSHSRQEHKTRTSGEEDSSILRIQFPVARFQPACLAGRTSFFPVCERLFSCTVAIGIATQDARSPGFRSRSCVSGFPNYRRILSEPSVLSSPFVRAAVLAGTTWRKHNAQLCLMH